MASTTIRTVVTLRARRLTGDPPRTGELMASASGKTVYRILGVVTLRTAGDPRADRFRLDCGRLTACQVPADATIHPWRYGHTPPPGLGQGAIEAPPRCQTAAGPPKAIQPRPSARTRGVEEKTVADLGPGLRRRASRDKHGRLLRDLDVEVDDRAVDPRNPNRRLRRAYRVDPVDVLKRAGSIGAREVDAAGELRRHLEQVAPPLGAGRVGSVAVSGFLIQPITDQHIRACRKVREASAILGAQWWPPVLWVCLGGTVRGYSDQWRVGTHTASELISSGMARLADHFYGSAA
jgi:hypothetical protein